MREEVHHRGLLFFVKKKNAWTIRFALPHTIYKTEIGEKISEFIVQNSCRKFFFPIYS